MEVDVNYSPCLSCKNLVRIDDDGNLPVYTVFCGLTGWKIIDDPCISCGLYERRMYDCH